MCGITGYISENITSSELEHSVNSIKHRGPNNQSKWIDKNVGFGHTRLSIIDLSEQANQPIESLSKRYIMVFNGEIYNYKELSQKHRLQLKTNSDSEVILELFEKIGSSFVKELNGMFSIAIFDKQSKELFLFRDRLGIKPLFYFFDGENFAFASEIKALLEYRIIKNRLAINKPFIAQFLN